MAKTKWYRSGFRGYLQKILKVKTEMMKTDGRSRNSDEAIKELVEFWKKHQ